MAYVSHTIISAHDIPNNKHKGNLYTRRLARWSVSVNKLRWCVVHDSCRISDKHKGNGYTRVRWSVSMSGDLSQWSSHHNLYTCNLKQ